MSITNYTTLVSALDGASGWLHRTDLTSRIPEFIQLAEADMQVRCKLVEFESTATVAVVAGVGTLPTDLVAMRSIYWDGDYTRQMKYVTPGVFDSMRENTGDALFYTISGLTLRTSPPDSENVILTYSARFLPITASNLTNSLITNYPDAYLFGALHQAHLYTLNDAEAAKYLKLFDNAVGRIKTTNEDRKYAGSTLQVRAV